MQQADGWREPEIPVYGKPSLGGRPGPNLEAVKRMELEPIACFPANTADHLGALAHDARNLLAALELYCDLLEEPGVLWPSYMYYAGELRLVAGAGRRLVEKLMLLDPALRAETPSAAVSRRSFGGPQLAALHTDQRSDSNGSTEIAWREGRMRQGRSMSLLTGWSIKNLAEEVQASRNLLAALAGSQIQLELGLTGGRRPVAMSSDDLTRVLVNLVKNAAEAMPDGGSIQIAVDEVSNAGSRTTEAQSILPGIRLRLSIADTGEGIPTGARESIFTAGFTSRMAVSLEDAKDVTDDHGHRGLGLAIVRSLVHAAGGTIEVSERSDGRSGAVFRMEFPVPV